MVALFYSFGNLRGLCDTAVRQGLTRNKSAINTHMNTLPAQAHTWLTWTYVVGGLPERDDVRPVNRRQQELGTSILCRGTVSDLPQDGGKQLIDIRRPQFLLSGVGTRVRARKVVFFPWSVLAVAAGWSCFGSGFGRFGLATVKHCPIKEEECRVVHSCTATIRFVLCLGE